MTSLVRKIVRLDELLTQARIPHAFGGAFALAYHTREPRGTIDIDVNIDTFFNAEAPFNIMARPSVTDARQAVDVAPRILEMFRVR